MARAPLAQRFQSLYAHGFVRAATAAPLVRLADPAENARRILALAKRADEDRAALFVAPELALSGYAIDDLIQSQVVLDAAEAALALLREESKKLMPLLIVGAPLRAGGATYNCAVAIHRGKILGVAPKTFLPTYREYYERRQFASASDAAIREISVGGELVPFGSDLLFAASDHPDFIVHAEICEDMWAPAPPSTWGALAGATVLANLSASNITIGKARDRDILIEAHAMRTTSAYLYAAAGHGESTTDVAWDGQLVAFEMGTKLGESARFSKEPGYLSVDVDVEKLAQERRHLNTFRDSIAREKARLAQFRTIAFTLEAPREALALRRAIPRFPFVPDEPERLNQDCYEAYNIQVEGLVTRLEATKSRKAIIGVSGGLDSTQALIVAARAMDVLARPRSDVIGVTLPGFATSEGTKSNAWKLMRALGVDAREVSIVPLAEQLLKDLHHPAAQGEPVYDVTYENVQAGLRTDFLFRLANKENGLVVGTGDLSELALGWATYGVGDHMSHYNVNAGAAKTLIQHLIRWVATQDIFGEETSRTLTAIVETEISPELVPPTDGQLQSTEDKVGPYALQDFNLHMIMRWGFRPSKTLFLAWSAWKDVYSYEEIRKWLRVFLERFFTLSQFKRSAVPNGPKLSPAGALSPRGDWRAPSDGNADAWLRELDEMTPERLT
ncbi:MAG: NAD(+) synthase [Hyphomonadaceae bacterium]